MKKDLDTCISFGMMFGVLLGYIVSIIVPGRFFLLSVIGGIVLGLQGGIIFYESTKEEDISSSQETITDNKELVLFVVFVEFKSMKYSTILCGILRSNQ